MTHPITNPAMLESVFLRPFGLAALAAAIPVIILYLFKPNPTRVAFPAVEFLLQDREKSRNHPALRRLRRNALLFIQLLAIALFAVSLASPYVPVSEQRTVEETVFVLDESASMATKTSGTTRFARAVTAAKDGVTDENSIVVSGVESATVAQRVPPAEAKAVLDERRATDAIGDLSSAIDRAAAVAGDDARIVVLSDFADGSWRTAVAAARAGGYTVTLRQFAGGGTNNVGAIDYSFANGTVAVRIKNFGTERATRRVALGDNTQSVVIKPGDVERVRLPVPAGGGRLRLTPGDSFPVDDEIAVAAPAEPTVDVLVLTNDVNRPLVTALSVIRGTRVTVKNPPTSVTSSYDVVVFSNVEPGRLLDGTRQVAHETVAKGGGVVIQAQSNMSGVDYGGLLLLSPNGTATRPTLRQPASNPLTEDVTFPAPSRYVTGNLRGGQALLRTVNGTALLAIAGVDRGRVLYYGYPDKGSAFERNYRYAVFWKRAVYRLTDRRSLSAMNRRTGERVSFDGKAMVDTPTNTRRTNALTLEQVGFYEGGGKRYGASLANVIESNVTASPVTAEDESNRSSARTDTSRIPLELTPLAALLVIAAVLIEVAFLRYRGDL